MLRHNKVTDNLSSVPVNWGKPYIRKRERQGHTSYGVHVTPGYVQVVDTWKNLATFYMNISLIRYLLMSNSAFSLLIIEPNLVSITSVLIHTYPINELPFHLNQTNSILSLFRHNSTIALEKLIRFLP